MAPGQKVQSCRPLLSLAATFLLCLLASWVMKRHGSLVSLLCNLSCARHRPAFINLILKKRRFHAAALLSSSLSLCQNARWPVKAQRRRKIRTGPLSGRKRSVKSHRGEASTSVELRESRPRGVHAVLTLAHFLTDGETSSVLNDPVQTSLRHSEFQVCETASSVVWSGQLRPSLQRTTQIVVAKKKKSSNCD